MGVGAVQRRAAQARRARSGRSTVTRPRRRVRQRPTRDSCRPRGSRSLPPSSPTRNGSIAPGSTRPTDRCSTSPSSHTSSPPPCSDRGPIRTLSSSSSTRASVRRHVARSASTCTCPDTTTPWAPSDGWCKHALAALLAVADEVAVEPEVLARWRGARRRATDACDPRRRRRSDLDRTTGAPSTQTP